MSYEQIALTEAQLAVVQSAATAVPPRWKSRFLSHIADTLTGRPGGITDADVTRAVGNAHRAIVLGIGTPALEDE
jgi:hypothetical protein